MTLIKNPYIPNANPKSPLPSIYILKFSCLFCQINSHQFPKSPLKIVNLELNTLKMEVWTLHFGGQTISSFGPWSEWSDWHPLPRHTAYYQHPIRDNVVLKNIIWIF